MQVLSLTLVLFTLQVGSWSRRRRSSEDGDKVRVRRSGDTKIWFNFKFHNSQLTTFFCKLENQTPYLICTYYQAVKRATQFNHVTDACVYTRKLEMCGIQLSCSCCNTPTFG